ncbi:VTT domain-containing protein [Bryobacter aggregatus]|uniref:VTT domain-containing protein n=1 Tax=Bryobacter aggregatus TaxID=360054 RepID=UPI0004E22206|nr:VTT domain-containing protein [Bryobacter aggregatus]
MDSIQQLIELIKTLISAEKLRALFESTLTGWPGYLALFAIIFSETGLLIGLFLPGDSLLFIVGVLCGAEKLDYLLVNSLLIVAAIVGDATGYYLGHQAGKAVYSWPDGRLFKRKYLQQTEAFYQKHGGKTIIYARFVPIIRTFAPFVAGVGRMSYRRFLSFNIFGGIGWVLLFTTMGYLLGGIPIIQKYFDKVILLILVLSVLPVAFETWKARTAS